MYFLFAFLLIFISPGECAFKANPPATIVLHPRLGLKLSQQAEPAQNVTQNLKVKVFGSCLVKSQCPQNSYCGLFEEFNHSICGCNDGWIASEDNSTCIVMYSCSEKSFNSDECQGDCPYATQFCRNEVCLCFGDYAYNSTKQCEWNVPDMEPEPKKIPSSCLITTVTKIKQPSGFFSNLSGIGFMLILVVAIFVLLSVALFIIWSWAYFRNLKLQPTEIVSEMELRQLNPPPLAGVRIVQD